MGEATSTATHNYELMEMVFLNLSAYGLVVASNVCTNWEEIILRSKHIRLRLMSEPVLEVEEKDFNLLITSKSHQWFYRISQRFSEHNITYTGSVLILRNFGIDIKLSLWFTPVLPPPADAKAYFCPISKHLIWGYVHPAGCKCRDHMSLKSRDTYKGKRAVQLRRTLEKYFGEMLEMWPLRDER
jgi:hypothetical protein